MNQEAQIQYILDNVAQDTGFKNAIEQHLLSTERDAVQDIYNLIYAGISHAEDLSWKVNTSDHNIVNNIVGLVAKGDAPHQGMQENPNLAKLAEALYIAEFDGLSLDRLTNMVLCADPNSFGHNKKWLNIVQQIFDTRDDLKPLILAHHTVNHDLKMMSEAIYNNIAYHVTRSAETSDAMVNDEKKFLEGCKEHLQELDNPKDRVHFIEAVQHLLSASNANHAATQAASYIKGTPQELKELRSRLINPEIYPNYVADFKFKYSTNPVINFLQKNVKFIRNFFKRRQMRQSVSAFLKQINQLTAKVKAQNQASNQLN